VLAARLRKLEELGSVTRDPRAARAVPGYCRPHAGLELRPMLQIFRQWSERFVPEDPAMVERDLDIVLKWLAGRIDPEHLPAQQVVLDLNIGGTRVKASLARVGARRGAVDLHRRSRPGRGPALSSSRPTCGVSMRYLVGSAAGVRLSPIVRSGSSESRPSFALSHVGSANESRLGAHPENERSRGEPTVATVVGQDQKSGSGLSFMNHASVARPSRMWKISALWYSTLVPLRVARAVTSATAWSSEARISWSSWR
jgi:hypothetical protein